MTAMLFRSVLLLFLVLLGGTPSVAASPPLELVTQRTSATKQMSTTVSTGGADLSPQAFVAAILDADHYPLSATYMGVQAVVECRTLERRPDGYTVVYTRLGGNALVKPRHYVIALKVSAQTDSRAVVTWDLVRHDFDGSAFSGPYAAALNAHLDAVYIPYDHGSWTYDRDTGTITYLVVVDPGGSIPSFMMTEDSLLTFPRELLKVKWGITPS